MERYPSENLRRIQGTLVLHLEGLVRRRSRRTCSRRNGRRNEYRYKRDSQLLLERPEGSKVCNFMTNTRYLLTVLHSILLRAIISRAPIGANLDSLISHENFETLGRLCFTQLVDLRHRGAFSTVAQTFAAFCQRCFSVDDEVLTILPGKWYQVCLLIELIQHPLIG